MRAVAAGLIIFVLMAFGFIGEKTRVKDDRGVLTFALAWAMICLWSYLGIIVHELAHALAGWLVGFEVWSITFGRGRCLFSRSIGSTLIEWRIAPWMGMVSTFSDKPRGYKWRKSFIIAAGPLANLLLIACAIMILATHPTTATASGEHLLLWWQGCAFANVLLLFGSLFSRKTVDTGSGKLEHDGPKLRKLLRSKPLSSEAFKARQQSIRLTSLINRGDREPAMKLMREIAPAAFERPAMACLKASVLFMNRDYEGARVILQTLLDRHEPADQFRAYLHNFLAWTDLMIASPDLLNEAESNSADAFALTPWSAAVQSTRGHLMVGRGDLPGGINLLRRAFKGVESQNGRAATLCSMAIASHRLNQTAAADKMLRRAAQLDPRCELLPRARQVMAHSPSSLRSSAPSTH